MPSSWPRMELPCPHHSSYWKYHMPSAQNPWRHATQYDEIQVMSWILMVKTKATPACIAQVERKTCPYFIPSIYRRLAMTMQSHYSFCFYINPQTQLVRTVLKPKNGRNTVSTWLRVRCRNYNFLALLHWLRPRVCIRSDVNHGHHATQKD